MPPDESTKPKLTPDEFLGELQKLSETDKNRLLLYAKNRCLACRFEAEDLLHEAITRTLEGIRNCPVGVGVKTHLYKTMRSISHSELKSLDNHGEDSLTVEFDESESHQRDVQEDCPTPEDEALAGVESARVRGEVFSLFEDDEVAQFVLECWIEDMTAAEIREATDMDHVAYDSKTRKIYRRIRKQYPRGFYHE